MIATPPCPSKAFCPVTETYYDIQDLLRKLVHRFRRTHGWMTNETFDDMMAEANLAFMMAYRCYDSREAEFTTWVQSRVTYYFLEKYRKLTKNHVRGHVVEAPMEDFQDTACLSDRMRQELSEESYQVYEAVLQVPMEVKLSLKEQGKHVTPKRIRKAVKEYFYDQGWSPWKVQECFQEIKEALS
mgnify:CR=1 FL=1